MRRPIGEEGAKALIGRSTRGRCDVSWCELQRSFARRLRLHVIGQRRNSTMLP